MMEKDLDYILVNYYKPDMIAWLNTNPDFFDDAIQLALSNKQPYCWRAASLVWSCMIEDDPRVREYLSEILTQLVSKNEGHIRELLRILLKMQLNETQEVLLFDQCINVWKNTKHSPSLRCVAFDFIEKMGMKYPDLTQEILFHTESHYLHTLSPGIRRSIKLKITRLRK